MSWVGLKCLVRNTFLVDFETWYEILCSSLNMQIFDLTCLSLTSITFERIELQSSDWTQKSRFFKLYPNMLSVHFDFILICSFSGEKLKSVFFFWLKLYCCCKHAKFSSTWKIIFIFSCILSSVLWANFLWMTLYLFGHVHKWPDYRLSTVKKCWSQTVEMRGIFWMVKNTQLCISWKNNLYNQVS